MSGRALNHDVIGVVMEFAASSVGAVHGGAAKVNSKWHEAFLEHEPLWTVLMKQKWPNTKQRHMTMPIFRARSFTDKRLKPLDPTKHRLTEIENCAEFNGRCPIYAEKLTETDQVDAQGNPILWCGTCNMDVHVCDNTEGILQNRTEGRCTRFARALVKKRAYHKVCLMYRNAEEEAKICDAYLHYLAASPQVEVNYGFTTHSPRVVVLSPTLSPLLVEHDMEGDGKFVDPVRYVKMPVKDATSMGLEAFRTEWIDSVVCSFAALQELKAAKMDLQYNGWIVGHSFSEPSDWIEDLTQENQAVVLYEALHERIFEEEAP